ncbi:MAG: hypothetical protein LUC26_05580 [Prevotella sp.]|nr:hypothetical protein [Prevotella sp.]
MKYFNIKIAMAVATLLAFTACSDDDDYTAGTNPAGEGYYFPSTAGSSIELSITETSFDIEVCRAKTEDAASAQITATVLFDDEDASSLFTIPSSVSFGAGEGTATLTIGYDPDAIEYNTYTFTLSVEGTGETTPYGDATYTFTAAASQPWISLGMATYTDDFMTTFWAVDNVSYEVEIQENGITPGLFRLVYPYGEAYPYNESYDDGTADWDLTQTHYLEINACDPDRVYITRQETGMDWGDSEYIVWSMADYYMQYGYTADEVDALGYFGTYADGVITFPKQALIISMADSPDDLYYANINGAFKVVMPGVTVADYSASVAYTGKFTDANGTNEVIGSVTLGSDVESARVALVAGKDITSAVADIEDGAIDYTTVTASGTVTFPCEESGTYSLVVVTYGNGAAQETASATFNYSVGAEETWTAAYVGDYEYSYFWEGTDADLVLYNSDSDPNRWKIEHWGYDVDFCFTFDQTTGEIIVDDQETGYEYGSYGMVYVDDLVDYIGDTSYGYSYYSNGTFYFAVIYYCSAGYFGYGYETFTLTSNAAKAISKAKAKAGAKKSSPKVHATKVHANRFTLNDVSKYMIVK